MKVWGLVVLFVAILSGGRWEMVGPRRLVSLFLFGHLAFGFPALLSLPGAERNSHPLAEGTQTTFGFFPGKLAMLGGV